MLYEWFPTAVPRSEGSRHTGRVSSFPLFCELFCTDVLQRQVSCNSDHNLPIKIALSAKQMARCHHFHKGGRDRSFAQPACCEFIAYCSCSGPSLLITLLPFSAGSVFPACPSPLSLIRTHPQLHTILSSCTKLVPLQPPATAAQLQ